MTTKRPNPNCDNQTHCWDESGETRILPLNGENALSLCRACFTKEILWRLEANRTLAKDCQWDTPMWETLEINTLKGGVKP